MFAPFVGNHAAIDFLNTAFAPSGASIETIGDGKAYLAWLVAAGLLDEDRAAKLARRFGVKALDEAAAEAREVREWARDWLLRWRSRSRADFAAEIAALNKLLARETRRCEVVPATDGGLELVERSRVSDASGLLALVVARIARLITEEDPTLIKACAGSGCTLWFLDRTKSHRRRFCSASACGNRAKVAAFRTRQRG
jgi:predicted RNA-binding Zn ribbon-like protein